MIVVIAKEGHSECEKCPFYVAEGCVKVYGGERRTKCGFLMKPYWLDCNIYDISTIRVARVDNRFYQVLHTLKGIAEHFHMPSRPPRVHPTDVSDIFGTPQPLPAGHNPY